MGNQQPSMGTVKTEKCRYPRLFFRPKIYGGIILLPIFAVLLQWGGGGGERKRERANSFCPPCMPREEKAVFSALESQFFTLPFEPRTCLRNEKASPPLLLQLLYLLYFLPRSLGDTLSYFFPFVDCKRRFCFVNFEVRPNTPHIIVRTKTPPSFMWNRVDCSEVR